MNINTRYIKVAGRDEIARNLEMGESIKITMEGEIVKIDHKSNQDGTIDVIYHFKPFGIDTQ